MDTFTFQGGPRAPGSEAPNQAGLPGTTFNVTIAEYDPAVHELVSWYAGMRVVVVRTKR